MTSRREGLPRGRHELTREEVESSQRGRLLVAMTEVVGEKGYVATSVADVLERAGVSRATFYVLFKDKEACFCEAFERAAGAIGEAMLVAFTETALDDGFEEMGTDLRALSSEVMAAQIDRMLMVYLRGLMNSEAFARTFLVEVFAAGPRAVAQRVASMERMVDVMASTLFGDAPTPAMWYAVETVVHAASSMVTLRVGVGEWERLMELHAPLSAMAQQLVASLRTTGL